MALRFSRLATSAAARHTFGRHAVVASVAAAASRHTFGQHAVVASAAAAASRRHFVALPGAYATSAASPAQLPKSLVNRRFSTTAGTAPDGKPWHKLEECEKGVGLICLARCPIPAGSVLFTEIGEIKDHRTTHSVQISFEQHTHFDGEGRYVSHSFEPNCCAHLGHRPPYPLELVALRDIAEGETLSWNYTSTEWDMVDPFADIDTGEKCRGFKHNSPERRQEMLERGLIAPHILRLWIKELQQAKASAQASA